jgi:hypothetical protein
MMNAYQRPLFRQAGGPAGLEALPAPPPAGVAAIPQQDPRAMVEAAEQGASSEMESIGQDYVLNMVNNLDSAEDFKTVIDSLRGNEMSLDQRVAELAGYVGEKDAGQTPESVLAMVQPVIMLTEEGNVDSGIGQLMQSLTGEVDMVTEEGDLTDMGQGVGSLMVANQPQQFANGGAVQHFANGQGVYGPVRDPDYYGESYIRPFNTAGLSPRLSRLDSGPRMAPETDIKSLFPQYREMFRDVLDSDAQRKQAQSGIMFDIAQAGLNLASGVDPRTGESTTRLPMASQIATAASGLPGMVSERIASVEDARRSGDLAALDASMQQVGSERNLTQQIESQESLAAMDLENQFIVTEAKLRAEGEWRAADRLSDEWVARLQLEYAASQDEGTLNNMRRMLGDVNMLQRYAAGEEMVDYENALAIVYGQTHTNAAGNDVMPEIPQSLREAARRRAQGIRPAPQNPVPVSVPGYITGYADGGAVQHFSNGGPPDRSVVPPEFLDESGALLPGVTWSPTFKEYSREPQPEPEEPLTSITRGTTEDPVTSDLRKAFGPRAVLARAGNTLFEAFTGGLLGPDNIMTIAPETKEAVSAVNTLARNAQLAMLDAVSVRNNVPIQDLIRGLTTPGGEFFTSLSDARLQSRDTLRLLQRTFESENNLLQTNEGPLQQQLTGADRSDMVQRVNRIGGLIEDYKLLVQSLDLDTRDPEFRDPMNEILGISEE